MIRLMQGAAFAAMMFTAAQASAASLVTVPGNWDEMLHNTAASTANSVLLQSQPGGYDVTFTGGAGELLDQAGNGGGFATVDGPFTALTITSSDTDLLGFDAIGFKLSPQAKYAGKNLSDYSLFFDLTFTSGGPQTLSVLAGGFPSNGKFDILADPGQVITSVKIYGLSGVYKDKKLTTAVSGLAFDDIRQISFDAALAPSPSVVPEPATWAMMIVGFGAVGTMVRSSRRRLAIA